MIQGGFDYGDGYEKASEPGPDVECFCDGEFWSNNTKYNTSKYPNEMFDIYEFTKNCIDFKYRKPIKPKDEKTEKKTVIVNVIRWSSPGHVELTLAEAEKAGEEVKRIKAEIAKREEIGPGDWFVYDRKRVCKCKTISNLINGYDHYNYVKGDCKKLHPTPEVRAWLDKTIGGEG
jgi:hypothetical protein